MKTDLETMIGYLAGRDGPGTTTLRAELKDPSSDASRFLETARTRTRSLVADRTAPTTRRPAPASRPRARKIPARAAVVALIVIAGAAVLGLGELRDRRFRALMEQTRVDARSQALHLEQSLARPAIPTRTEGPRSPGEPIALALNRVEEGLGKLERRLDGLARPTASSPPPAASVPPPDGSDGSLAEIRAEMAAIRRESASSEQATARQLQEMRTVLGELNRVIRQAVSQPQAVPANPMLMPNLNFGPNPQGIDAAQFQAIVNNLSSPHPQVRLEAAEHLSRLGPTARPAVQHLRQMLHHEPDGRVRSAAQSAITRLQPE